MYQELEDYVSTFGFKTAFQIVTSRNVVNVITEYTSFIYSYPSITQYVIDSHFENMWVDNPGTGLGSYPTEDYVVAENDTNKQAIIYQCCLRSNIMSLWIRNLLITDAKRNLGAFKTSNYFNVQ